MISHTAKGKLFQLQACGAVSRLLGQQFDIEVALPIGNPAKLHPFDLASRDRRYVGETKAFTWTVSGNVPSAKITTLREAVQYLQSLPPGTKGFLIVEDSRHPKTGESLAHYFVRLNEHLLGSVVVIQMPQDGTNLETVRGSL